MNQPLICLQVLSRATFTNLVTVLRLVVQGLEASYVANTTSAQQTASGIGAGGMASAFLLLEVLHTHYSQSGTQSTAALSAGAGRAGSISISTSTRQMPLPLAPTPGGSGSGSGHSSARSSHTVSPRHDAPGAAGAPGGADAEVARRGSSSPMAPSETLPALQNSLSKPSGGAEGSNLVSTFGTAHSVHCKLFSLPGWLVLVFLQTNLHLYDCIQ